MGKLIDLTGKRFGQLTVAHRAGTDAFGQAVWFVGCDCGASFEAVSANLRARKSDACDRCSSHAKHGMHGTPVYWVWNSMVRRCKNPTAQHYADYGGRGIAVCDRWLDFAGFYADMGNPPDGHSLDRIDVNGNYEPGNCRWATIDVQRHNTRSKSNTGHRGVSWIPSRNRFVWGVCRRGVHRKGRAKTLTEAIAARDAACLELYGELARNSLNSENGIVMTRRMRRLQNRINEEPED